MSENPYLNQWRTAMKKRTRLSDEVTAEMEDHLCDTAEELMGQGLYEEEAWIIAMKRLGSQSELADDLVKVHTERLYRELLSKSEGMDRRKERKSLFIMIMLALGAALASRVPGLMDGDFSMNSSLLLINASIIIIPFTALLFASFARPSAAGIIAASAALFLSFLAVNFYPMAQGGQSRNILALHTPLLLWFGISLLFPARERGLEENTVHYLRFTGEALLYGVLFTLGFFVLAALTIELFRAAGMGSIDLMARIFPSGLFAAPIIGAWLAEKKRNIIENLAPVLAKIFIPLFLVLIMAFLAVTSVRRSFYFADRSFLIIIDVMLFLVMAMSFYEISSRSGSTKAEVSDYLNFSLILSVLLADLLALGNILFRLSEYGFSINKTTALAENILLAVNLVVLAILYRGFFRKKRTFDELIRFQGRYMGVYILWCAFAVFILPAIFRFQ